MAVSRHYKEVEILPEPTMFEILLMGSEFNRARFARQINPRPGPDPFEPGIKSNKMSVIIDMQVGGIHEPR